MKYGPPNGWTATTCRYCGWANHNVVNVGALKKPTVSNKLVVSPYSSYGSLTGDCAPHVNAIGWNINYPWEKGPMNPVTGTSFSSPAVLSLAADLISYSNGRLLYRPYATKAIIMASAARHPLDGPWPNYDMVGKKGGAGLPDGKWCQMISFNYRALTPSVPVSCASVGYSWFSFASTEGNGAYHDYILSVNSAYATTLKIFVTWYNDPSNTVAGQLITPDDLDVQAIISGRVVSSSLSVKNTTESVQFSIGAGTTDIKVKVKLKTRISPSSILGGIAWSPLTGG
jgi:hypothetical protein